MVCGCDKCLPHIRCINKFAHHRTIAPHIHRQAVQRPVREHRDHTLHPLRSLPLPIGVAQAQHTVGKTMGSLLNAQMVLNCHLGHTISTHRYRWMAFGQRHRLWSPIHCAARRGKEQARLIGLRAQSLQQLQITDQIGLNIHHRIGVRRGRHRRGCQMHHHVSAPAVLPPRLDIHKLGLHLTRQPRHIMSGLHQRAINRPHAVACGCHGLPHMATQKTGAAQNHAPHAAPPLGCARICSKPASNCRATVSQV